MKEKDLMPLVCNDYSCSQPFDCPVPEEIPCSECPRHNCEFCVHYSECIAEVGCE